eukprot:364180-Chlamydomonas_euryale.AAC.2
MSSEAYGCGYLWAWFPSDGAAVHATDSCMPAVQARHGAAELHTACTEHVQMRAPPTATPVRCHDVGMPPRPLLWVWKQPAAGEDTRHLVGGALCLGAQRRQHDLAARRSAPTYNTKCQHVGCRL